MGKDNVVFIIPMYHAHANATIKISRLLQNKGFDVYYAGSIQLLRFTLKNKFKLFTLDTTPIHEPSLENLAQREIKKWLDIVQKNKLFNDYLTRKNELQILIQKLQPRVIFLDEFCYFDYVILSSLSTNLNIYLLQGKMGMYYNTKNPPGNFYSFPNRFTKYLWKFNLIKNRLKRIKRNFIFAGQTLEGLSKKILKVEQVSTTVKLNYNKIFAPSFIGVPELLMYPPEFDFPDNTLMAWQQYLPASVELERKEIISDNLKNFIENRNLDPTNLIIYCSLGTLTDIHLLQKNLKMEFIHKCVQIAANNPNYFFIISSGDDLKKDVYDQILTDNVLMLNFVPQLFILNKADLFLTHGGQKSVFEGIYTETPMMVFPLNNKWDQNGAAARVVYHNIGIKANITDSILKIEAQISKLLTDQSYKESIAEMAKKIKQKYTDGYFSDQLDKIIGFKNGSKKESKEKN
jgi:hypothetical protein